jgi:SAM-dependent methyltransferase
VATAHDVFDFLAPPGPSGDDQGQRVAKWLAGDRLSTVLHLGDARLAYLMSDQGHEVVVAGPDVRVRRSRDVLYVRTETDRLPFGPDAFDTMVVQRYPDTVTAVAEHARVLRPGGYLSTVVRSLDESVPWVRRLREIVGTRGDDVAGASSLPLSVGFDEPEVEDVVAWEELDRAGLVQLARALGDPEVVEREAAAVHALFDADAGHTGRLRLRHRTRCLRARVLKERPTPTPSETTLFDLS